jgi:type VI secretion system secreted protein VgrG
MPQHCLLKTPLPEGTLRLQTCTAQESLSQLSDITVTALATASNLAAYKLLGKPATVVVTQRDGSERELSGYISRFAQTGFNGSHHEYQLTIKPWLWLLTRTADCKIFQDMTIPEIVKAVFDDHPVANFEFKLFQKYRKWTYCVQYRESDFNFIARLLEHEGIYWYFDHTGGQHKLMLVDSASVHNTTPGRDSLPYYSNTGQRPPDLDYISVWASAFEVEPGRMALTDYDFERPATALLTEDRRARSYDLSDAEVFDFPGGYLQTPDGAHYAETRIEELQTPHQLYSGTANTVGLRVGHRVKLSRHPRDDQNAEYLVTGTTFHIQHAGHESGEGEGEASFQCSFTALAANDQYRPARRTPKPSVLGPQSAVVVGPAGEEIYTDKYGRVKVQFHWDRYGQKNDKSSCWLRVATPWAGSSYGGIHIPPRGGGRFF